MAILVQCAACGQRFSAAEHLAGKQAICSCKATINVPTPGPPLTLLDDSVPLAVPSSSFAHSPLAVPARHRSSVLDHLVHHGQPTLLTWGLVACTLLLMVCLSAAFYLAFTGSTNTINTIAATPEPVQKVIWDGPHGRNYRSSLPLPAALFPKTGEPPRTVPVHGWLEIGGTIYYGDEQPEVALRRGLTRVPDVIPETLEYYNYTGSGTKSYRVGLKQYPADKSYGMNVMQAVKSVGFVECTVGLHNDRFQITYTPTQLPASPTPAIPATLGPRAIDIKLITRITARNYNGTASAADALRAALTPVDGLMPESIVFDPEQGYAQAYIEKPIVHPWRIEAVLRVAGFQQVQVSMTTRYEHVTVNERGEVSPPLALPKNEPVASNPPAAAPPNNIPREASPAALPSTQPFTAVSTWSVERPAALPVQPRNDVTVRLTDASYGIPPTLHFTPRQGAKALVREGSGKLAPTTLIDLLTGQATRRGTFDADQILGVSPAGQAVLEGTNQALRVWQWDQEQPRLVATLPQPEIQSHYDRATFLDDRRVLIGSSTDNVAWLWNLQTNRLEWGLQDCEPKHAVLSPDLHYLAIANSNGTQVNLYATLNLQCAGTLSSGSAKRHFRNLFFSPDGKQLFAQIIDPFRQHWLVGYDLTNGQPYQSIQLPSENNNSVFFACADQRFVVVRSVASMVVVDLQYQQVVWAYDQARSILQETSLVRQDPAGRVWHFQSLGEAGNAKAHQLLRGDYVPREREVNEIDQKLARRAPLLKAGDTVRLEIKVLGQSPEQGFEDRLRQAITKQLATRKILVSPQSTRTFSVTVTSREGSEDVRPTLYYISGENPNDRIVNRQQVSARELKVDVNLALVDEQGQTPWAWKQTTEIHPAAWNLQQGPIAPEVALRYLPWRHAITAIETLPFPAEFHPRTAGPIGTTRLPLSP